MNKLLCALLLLWIVNAASAQTSFGVSKTPFEAVDVSIDFSCRVAQPCASSNDITLSAVTATNVVNNRDNTAAIIVNAPSTPVPAVKPGTNVVVARVQGGNVGEQYNVAMRVTKIDTGEQLEGNVMVRIVSAQ